LGDGGVKRFLIYLLLFPAITTVALYGVLYILTGAVVDSLSGPAFCYLMFIGPALVVALVDWLASKTRIPVVIATTLFAFVVSALSAAWAGTIDVLVFGLIGAIPATICSWLSNSMKRVALRQPALHE
jgi:hypothetical protein